MFLHAFARLEASTVRAVKTPRCVFGRRLELGVVLEVFDWALGFGTLGASRLRS